MSKIESIDGESPLMDWVVANSKNIVWGIACLFLLLFLIFRLYSGVQAKEEKQYLEADNIYPQLFIPEKAANAAFQIETLIKKLPNLESEYDGLLAQSYLNQNLPQMAAAPLNRSLARLEKDSIAHYLTSSRIALLISEGKTDEAYAQSTQLKNELSSSPNALYYYNLFRLGMLAQSLGKKEDEKKIWAEFISYAQTAPGSFNAIVNAIDVKGGSLIAFIQERQKKLN